MDARLTRKLSLVRAVAICAIGLACQNAGDGADRIAIAIVPFGVAKGSAPPVDVAEVIRADLASSGRFAPIDAAAMPSHPTGVADIRFEEWQHAQADFLVVGRVARVHDGGHEIEFSLIDTRAQTALVAFMVPSAPDALERTALEIAEIIARRIPADPARSG